MSCIVVMSTSFYDTVGRLSYAKNDLSQGHTTEYKVTNIRYCNCHNYAQSRQLLVYKYSDSIDAKGF